MHLKKMQSIFAIWLKEAKRKEHKESKERPENAPVSASCKSNGRESEDISDLIVSVKLAKEQHARRRRVGHN
jgi:hypothetical protein